MGNPLSTFRSRVVEQWLPEHCEKHGCAPEGFVHESVVSDAQDVRDFLRALDSGLVVDLGVGQFKAIRRGKVKVGIFSHGSKKKRPQLVRLSLEPIIAIAVAARLHLDLGWPQASLEFEPAKWEFDLATYRPTDPDDQCIACEVKKTSKEIADLLVDLKSFCADPRAHNGLSKQWQNSHKKFVGLRKRGAR